jgi:hypothetical protein
VFEETALSVTGIRTKATDYVDCTACTTANPCPSNYEVTSCCNIDNQIFVPVMPGVNVGDTFVDTYGNCWSVDGTNSRPITNVVYADTVYSATDCESDTCTNANPCPTFFALQSCCIFGNDVLYGITTSVILGPGYVQDDYFVDQFGICWWIKTQLDFPEFPTLGFITPVTEYVDCETCTTANTCPTSIFYTLQDCCTGDIEIWESGDAYVVGSILAGDDGVNNYCYKILSFDVVGPATLVGFTLFNNYRSCNECIRDIQPCL